MSKSAPRTVTESGSVLHQRTPRGWVNSMGLWPLFFAISALLFTFTLPPTPPYCDVVLTALMALGCGWRVFNASRQMVVALGDQNILYVGMGRSWFVSYRDLTMVDFADAMGLFALPMSSGMGKAEGIPRFLIFVHGGRRSNIHLSWFDAEALLLDLDARLPPKVIERSPRYREVLAAIRPTDDVGEEDP